MTTLSFSITVHECNVGKLRIIGIANGPQCTTCLTLSNGQCISLYAKDIETKDIVSVTDKGHDYIVRIDKQVA